jgi:hercynylcysteine S-oxide lyase
MRTFVFLLLFVEGIGLGNAFGHSLLDLFLWDRSYLNVNHGSYGSAPKYVPQKLREYQQMAESNPDRWFRVKIQQRMNAVRETLSTYVRCDPDDLVQIDNASTGINSILKPLKFASNETILYYNVAYGMVKLTLEYVSNSGLSRIFLALGRFPAELS